MKRTKRFLSLVLSLLIVMSVMLIGGTTVFAADTTINYSFTKDTAGYAQGTITVSSATDKTGTYYLYWADDTKALEGYAEIGTINIAAGQGMLTMPPYTVIPADATKVIAFKATSEPSEANRTVAKASAVYSIPADKQLAFGTSDALYTFGAISDPQIANDSYGSGSYPYDEVHWEAALETLHDRDVDFVISSGDTVNDQNGKQTYAAEYKRYQQILADSSYANPIYEANGNHDVGTVWNKNGDYYNIDDPFVIGTGLDSVADSINTGKPYFEITEPVTGDHFIFMALEGGFYTDRGTQFSTAQLDWLEGLLKKYSGDGKNIFIIEHANIQGWGAGDKLTTPYYYDLGLNRNSADVKRFISLMETYKDCVVISGHTHLELSAQYNYCDNNGTSAVTIHNSAIGGVRRLVNGSIDRTAVLGLSEGYIVDVYEDCIVFNGTNLYHNEIMPMCSYIVPFDTEAIEKPTEPTTTEATEPTTTEATEPATTEATEPTTTEATESTTAETTETASTESTTANTEPIVETMYGDADCDGKINVKDATAVQKHAADLIRLSEQGVINGDVSGEGTVNVVDATYIQKFVAEMIIAFPAERTANVASVGAVAPEYERAKQVLDDYYMYSSYDQYMALKRAYLYDAGDNYAEVLPELESELAKLVEAIGGNVGGTGGEITVYFTNNYNWSTVKAHIWGTGGDMTSWPGTTMTYAKTNSQSQDIYSVTLNYEDYQNIIFTDGSKQTVDIALTGENGIGYYISGESGGKYTCSTYTYS